MMYYQIYLYFFVAYGDKYPEIKFKREVPAMLDKKNYVTKYSNYTLISKNVALT